MNDHPDYAIRARRDAAVSAATTRLERHFESKLAEVQIRLNKHKYKLYRGGHRASSHDLGVQIMVGTIWTHKVRGRLEIANKEERAVKQRLMSEKLARRMRENEVFEHQLALAVEICRLGSGDGLGGRVVVCGGREYELKDGAAHLRRNLD